MTWKSIFKLIEFIIPQNLFGISDIEKVFLGIIYTILALGKANYIKH